MSPTTPNQSNAPKQLSHQVTAVSYPLAFFAQQLVDDSIDVHAVVPTTGLLESWRPTKQVIASMQRSDLIIVNGSAAPFAKWLPHVTLPESKLCQTANDGLKLSDMIAVEDIRLVHSHGPEGEHSHPTMVAHCWLDPEMAKKQVNLIAKRLATTYPSKTTVVEQNRAELTRKLDALSKKIETLGSKTKPRVVATSSPNLKFLTRALGWTDLHMVWSELPDVETAKQELDAKLSESESDVALSLFLWSTRPSEDFLTMSESRKLHNVVIDTMTFPPETGDYFSVMEENLHRLVPVQKQAEPKTE